jgi:hypothetical protein
MPLKTSLFDGFNAVFKADLILLGSGFYNDQLKCTGLTSGNYFKGI